MQHLYVDNTPLTRAIKVKQISNSRANCWVIHREIISWTGSYQAIQYKNTNNVTDYRPWFRNRNRPTIF